MREIDKLPSVEKRPKEMQVLCLGLSRTATRSLWTALQELGYTPYHGNQLFTIENSKYRHNKCWAELLTAKFHNGPPCGVVEFDKLLGNYDSVTDCPCACFPEELIAAYPDAKIILTTRDPDRWVQSMESIYYRILDLFAWNPIVYLRPNEWGAFRRLVRIILMLLTSGDWQNRKALRQGFLNHNDLVRSLAPKDRFLEFRAEQGWGPLCRFLEKPEPLTPYPNTNAGNETADIVQMVAHAENMKMMKKALPTAGAIMVVILSVVAWRLW